VRAMSLDVLASTHLGQILTRRTVQSVSRSASVTASRAEKIALSGGKCFG
jgi:hypothetical protein